MREIAFCFTIQLSINYNVLLVFSALKVVLLAELHMLVNVVSSCASVEESRDLL